MNYKKVIQDYASGKINKDHWTVVMDNDGGYWCYHGPEVNDDSAEELVEEMERKYGTPGGYNDIVEVLDAAGVPAEWC